MGAAIEILMNEHRVIEQAIDALVAFTDEVQRGSGDRAELGRFVRFIRGFADVWHHGKEEDILFRAMGRAGFPTQGGPVAVMLMEHDIGRAHVRELDRLAGQAGAWTEADRGRVAQEALGYASLLRAHIHKEDEILYPMAEARLPPELMEEVDRDCETFERRQPAAAEHQELRLLADELSARHLPARGASAASP
ncbi:MAG: hemerythrin domain-containing protein [Deltaproteobacteria bacterium]|nr:hemerythrin domain-containing protein [Deltaproteobacteria bacterium]